MKRKEYIKNELSMNLLDAGFSETVLSYCEDCGYKTVGDLYQHLGSFILTTKIRSTYIREILAYFRGRGFEWLQF